MTSQEESEFFAFGCASRFIIKLCELRGMPISTDDFVNRYHGFLPAGQFGLLTVDRVCDVVRDLELCRSASAIRSSDLIQNLGIGIFLLTDKNIRGEHLFHFRLLVGVGTLLGSTTRAFRFYNVFQDGSEVEEDIALPDLEAQLPHFLILQPKN